MVNTLLGLRPVLTLMLLVAVIWLAARALRRALLGRIGELGKMVVVGALVGIYALTMLLTAMGTPPPWLAVVFIPLGSAPTLAIILASAIVVWVVLHEIPFPMPHWIGFILEGPWRRLLMPADVTLNRMALGPGMRVVEVGCGTGHLSPHVARRIQPGGILFCVDIQPQMVEATLARVEKQGLRNVQGFVAPADKLPFDIFDVDLVFFAHVLGEIPDRLAALRDALRVMRPGAALSIAESLPDPHYRFRNDVVKLAQQAGFEPASVVGSLFNYTATFRKPKPREPLGYQPRFE
ncbi:class I SAM-dependent methyltransferase [candidate division WOR-3 bacterium]|nr:class I SAM-dependent methyltransferase [candidate division WOR-3 bacterium]